MFNRDKEIRENRCLGNCKQFGMVRSRDNKDKEDML